MAENFASNQANSTPQLQRHHFVRRVLKLCLYEGFNDLLSGDQAVVNPAANMRGRGQLDLVRMVIMPRIGIIADLTLLLNKSSHILSFLRIPAGQFRSLKKLRLSLIHENRQADFLPYAIYQDSFTVLQSLPRLRSLTIHSQHGPHPVLLMTPPQTPLSQLTALCFAGVKLTPETLLSTLEDLPLLEQGDFVVAFKRHTPPSPSIILPPLPTLQLPRLTRLRLTLHNPHRDGRLFAALQLESLIELELYGTGYLDGTGWNMAILIPLIHFSARTLEILLFREVLPAGASALEDRHLGMQDSIAGYMMDRLTTPLVHLKVLDIPIGVYLVKQSLNDISCGLLLPSLEYLNLSHNDAPAVLQMVIDRNENAQVFPRIESSNGHGGIMELKPISELVLTVIDDSVEGLNELQAVKQRLEEGPAGQDVRLVLRYPQYIS